MKRFYWLLALFLIPVSFRWGYEIGKHPEHISMHEADLYISLTKSKPCIDLDQTLWFWDGHTFKDAKNVCIELRDK